MPDSTPTVGPNFRDKVVKGGSFRLADAEARDTTDYAEWICGDGPPAGAYGRASGVTMFYAQKDADSPHTAMWVTADAGTTWEQLNGFDPSRYSLSWVAGSRGKPGINADMASGTEAVREIADPDFELLGTNAVSSCSAYNTGGGIDLVTTTGANDQVILVPHLDTSQSAWGTVLWPTGKSLIWECRIKTASAITSTIIWAGLKLTNTGTGATDDDQVFVRYGSADNGGEFEVWSSIAGTDTTTDTGIVVATSTEYHFRIVIDSSRIAKVYINGTLYLTTTALTSTNLIPYIGIQTTTTAAKTLTVRGQKISRIY